MMLPLCFIFRKTGMPVMWRRTIFIRSVTNMSSGNLAEKLGDSIKARQSAPMSSHDFGYAALQMEAKGDGKGYSAIGVPYHGRGVQVGRTDKPDWKGWKRIHPAAASTFGRGKDRQVTGSRPQTRKLRHRSRLTDNGKRSMLPPLLHDKQGEETTNHIEFMEEKKMQAVESGSLYMTLDAFYRPVYLSMRGQGEEGFSRYISNNVTVSYRRTGNLYPTTECSVSISRTRVMIPPILGTDNADYLERLMSGTGTGKDSSFGCGKTEGCGIL